MKRKLFTLLMLLVSVFTVVAISNTQDVEAYNNNSTAVAGKIYFVKPSDWTDSKVILMVGHNGYSKGYGMTKIGSTNIYYIEKSAAEFKDGTEFAFFNTSTVWGGEGSNITHRSAYASKSSRIIKEAEFKCDNANWYYIFGTGINENGEASSATGLNRTITANAEVGGVATVSGTKLTAHKTSGTSTNDVLLYTNATLTATANDGYEFGGWYNGATLVSSDATYTVKVTATATYTAKFKKVTPLLETLLSDAYNNGVYTRTTNINLAIEDEHVKADYYQHFHNAQNGENALAKRITEFVGNYLYFVETKVGFGTSSTGKLTQFTWKEGFEHASTGEYNAIEDKFVTLYDFMSLTEGWTLVDGKYVNTNDEVVKAAEAFTAPGWQPPFNYMTYTQVTVELVGNELVISLWVNAQADGTKLVEGVKVVDGNALFSQAIIG